MPNKPQVASMWIHKEDENYVVVVLNNNDIFGVEVIHCGDNRRFFLQDESLYRWYNPYAPRTQLEEDEEII